MRATIDSAGRLAVPKALRDELGFTSGTELELEAVDGRLEVTDPSRAREPRSEDAPRLDADTVRSMMERMRRR